MAAVRISSKSNVLGRREKSGAESVLDVWKNSEDLGDKSWQILSNCIFY